MTTIFDPIDIEFANSSENIDTISGITNSSFIRYVFINKNDFKQMIEF